MLGDSWLTKIWVPWWKYFSENLCEDFFFLKCLKIYWLSHILCFLKTVRLLFKLKKSALIGKYLISQALLCVSLVPSRAPLKPSVLHSIVCHILKRRLNTDSSPQNFQHISLGPRFSKKLSECGAHCTKVARSKLRTPNFFFFNLGLKKIC